MAKASCRNVRSLKTHPEFKDFWNSGIGVLITKLSTKNKNWHKKTIRLTFNDHPLVDSEGLITFNDYLLIDSEGFVIVETVLDCVSTDPDSLKDNYDFQPKDFQSKIVETLIRIINGKKEKALAQIDRLNAELLSSLKVILKY